MHCEEEMNLDLRYSEVSFCQAQPQLQVKLCLKAELLYPPTPNFGAFVEYP